MRRIARVDALTELPNRAQFFEALTAAVARSKRLDTGIAVMFLDIDRFGKLNAGIGQEQGNLVLQEFALRLKQTVRGTDTVARLAGDEFVVILEGLDSAGQADIVTQKILAIVGKPWRVADQPLLLTTSVGVAFDATHSHSATALINYADELLYAAKSAGGNTFRITVC